MKKIKKIIIFFKKNKNMIEQLEEKIVILSKENNILRTQLGIINSSDLDLDKIKQWIDRSSKLSKNKI